MFWDREFLFSGFMRRSGWRLRRFADLCRERGKECCVLGRYVVSDLFKVCLVRGCVTEWWNFEKRVGGW